MLWVQDPRLVSELYTTKNHLLDKTGFVMEATQAFMGNSFLFAKNDEQWKAKRRACAHAFYKDKLEHMIEVMKNITERKFESW